MSTNTGLPTLRHETLTSAGLPRRVRRVLEQLLALLADDYARDLERLLNEFEQELLRLAEQARNPALQSGYMDTLGRVRQHRGELVAQFLIGLESGLARIRDRDPASGAGDDAVPLGYGSLRLVDHHEVDENSALRSIAVRHESRGSLQLLLLGQRFGVLAGAPAFDASALPVGPLGICRVLATAAGSLQVNLDARLLLFRLFDRHLGLGYVPLLEAMNLLLIREGILPALSYVPLRTRRSARARQGEDRGDVAVPPPGPPTSPPAGRGSPSGEGSAAAASAMPAYTGWPGVAGNDGSAAGSEASTGDDRQVFELLQGLLTERRELVDKMRAGSGPRGPVPLSTAEVIAALAALQSQPSLSRAPCSVPDVRQTLLAQSRQQRGEATTLSREDGDTFELLGLLYSGISRELREDTPSTALLERLQLPLLRLALQDRGFFSRSQHPARQLLNTVAEAGARWTDEEEADPQLQQQLHTVVEEVVERFDGDAAVFEAANQSLQQHLQQMARKAEISERRHVEAARGKDKLELAKRRALEVVEAAVNGQRLPRLLQSLLSQAWADVLTLVLLRHGEVSEPWQRHQHATAQIVDISLRGGPVPAELARLIEEGLALVGFSGEEAAAIGRRLTSSDDTGDEDPASRTELAMKLKARTRLGPEEKRRTAPIAPRNEREQALYQHLRSLPFGTWIDFVINQQGDVVRRRMAWFSLVSDRVLFVNQRGQRVDEQTLDHLSRLLASDQAKIVTSENAQLVDRAWANALGSLRKLANRGARIGSKS